MPWLRRPFRAGAGTGPSISLSIAGMLGADEAMVLHYSDLGYWPAHQMLTDAYALQHSQGADPRARRSAVLHLAALYAQCKLGLSHDGVVPLRRAIAAERIDDALTPWPSASVTITDVLLHEGPAAHLNSVAAFGTGVAANWRAHRDFAESLCRRFLEP